MVSAEDLRAVHLAKLPELRTRTGKVQPSIARAIMTAILIDTDNGRHPIEREALAAAAGLSPAAAYLYMVISALALAELVTIGPPRQSFIGSATTRALRVNVERLRLLSRRPLCHGLSADDPKGAASLPGPRELFAVRDEVLERFGVGVEYVRKLDRESRRNKGDRIIKRAEVLYEVRRVWKERTGETLKDFHLAQLIGVDPACVVHAFKITPQPVGASS